jgi:propionyl-CoA:succinyl-CoA transferase
MYASSANCCLSRWWPVYATTATTLPLQIGVGNVANAVLEGLGQHPDVPDFQMYTEVFQAAAFELMRRGRLLGASACALTLSPEQMQQLAKEIDFFASRIVLRPQEISNNPAVVRQLGVIAMNTALLYAGKGRSAAVQSLAQAVSE